MFGVGVIDINEEDDSTILGIGVGAGVSNVLDTNNSFNAHLKGDIIKISNIIHFIKSECSSSNTSSKWIN